MRASLFPLYAFFLPCISLEIELLIVSYSNPSDYFRADMAVRISRSPCVLRSRRLTSFRATLCVLVSAFSTIVTRVHLMNIATMQAY